MDKFLVFWLGSTALSFGSEIYNELRDFKYAADNGYKIDIKKWNNSIGDDDSNTKKLGLLLLVTPGINLLTELMSTNAHVQEREEKMLLLKVNGALEEMTDFEKKVYSEKPTAIRALLISNICKSILDKCIKLTRKENDVESEIYFLLDRKNGINIVHVTGPYAKLSKEEQLNIIKDNLKMLLENDMFRIFYTNKEFDNYKKTLVEDYIPKDPDEDFKGLAEENHTKTI